MKIKTWNSLYQIRQYLIIAYVDDDNKKTKTKINRIIKSLTKIIDEK